VEPGLWRVQRRGEDLQIQGMCRTCEALHVHVRVCCLLCVYRCEAGLRMVLRPFVWWQLDGEALHTFVSPRMLLGCLIKSVWKD
jgi:hypothetical protein